MDHLQPHLANEYATFCHTELQIRQKKGLIDKNAVILAVEDPQADIGSGSATLNALLCVAEYLAAREGMTVSHRGGGRVKG